MCAGKSTFLAVLSVSNLQDAKENERKSNNLNNEFRIDALILVVRFSTP
jgi:hypothetical protein